MSLETTIGYIGSTTVAFLQVPQVLKTYRSKQADELSWGMVLLNLFASIIWFTYGVILVKAPIIVANIIYFISNVSLTVMKIKYQGNKKNSGKGVGEQEEIITV